jgi:hypothetical protein
MYLILLCICICRDSNILPEDLASQSVRLKEEQLKREEEKVSVVVSLFIYNMN